MVPLSHATEMKHSMLLCSVNWPQTPFQSNAPTLYSPHPSLRNKILTATKPVTLRTVMKDMCTNSRRHVQLPEPGMIGRQSDDKCDLMVSFLPVGPPE